MKKQSKPELGTAFPILDEERRTEMLRFLKLHAYEKKTGKNIQTLIKTARGGKKLSNYRAFFELIKIDKKFLFVEWAKQIILEEIEQRNKIFFEDLGDAVKYLPRQTKNTDLIKNLKKMIVEYPYSMEILSDRKKCQKFLDALIKEGFIDDSLTDIDVFRRLLERNGLIY